MKTFEDTWGPILRAREQREAAVLHQRLDLVERRQALGLPRERPAYMAPTEDVTINRGRERTLGIASSEVDMTAKIDTLTVPLDPNAGGGGGIPPGYEETAITLCIEGTQTPGTILFKPDA
jgi:hypothetical protein